MQNAPEYFMRQALLLGRRALPRCLPNPPVGCVLAAENEIVAQGFTGEPGQDHAEAMALRQVTGELSHLTAFVTLEPCSFYGRTPSCALSLIARRIGRVYVALLDPDPRNDGKGIALLQEAGIPVQVGLLAGEARADLEAYFSPRVGATPPLIL